MNNSDKQIPHRGESVAQALRLGVNIDHVATVRNARGGVHPDPVRAVPEPASGIFTLIGLLSIFRRRRGGDR